MSEHSPDLIRLVDVGAFGGVQEKWRPYAAMIWPIMFEPNTAAASDIRAMSREFPRCSVIECALSNIDGELPLFITRNPTCISLLAPNDELLKYHGIRVHFEVLRTERVNCARYDTLFLAGDVPWPDAIKLDVQGFEYQALQGFGGLLQKCIGIELEAHIYPLYRNQMLLHDVVSLLETYGLILSRIVPKTTGFDGKVVEVNAWFTRRRHEVEALDRPTRAKYDVLKSVWELP